MKRQKEQSLGVWLNETLIPYPDKMDRAVHDIARSGFGIIRLFLRNTNYTHRSPQVIKAVARMVKAGHAERLQVAIDCEPHNLVIHDMGNMFADAIGIRLVRAEARVVDGRFVIHVPPPSTEGSQPDFLGVESAFFFQDGKPMKKIKTLSYDLNLEDARYNNGFTRRWDCHAEGRPYGHCVRDCCLMGQLEAGTNGRLVVYARFLDTRLSDFWSPSFWRYYDMVLDCYRDIPLDGIGWDEPGVSGNWQTYRYGKSFAEAFIKRNGYSLADKLYLLDEGGFSSETAKVRMDYYETLNEGLFEAQRRMVAKTRKLFGKDALLGTHHTWVEGGTADYRAGAVDYFRLTDNMDAGYTDTMCWDAKSLCYANTLGSSLGRLTPSGEAEVNALETKPSNSQVRYNARFMTLMNITWFNGWYGEASDGCLYPYHHAWATTAHETKRHAANQKFIGEAKPVIDIAMLSGWETVAAINRADIAAAHKTYIFNAAYLCVERSVAFDWVDTRLIAQSKIVSNKLVNKLGKYAILVLPYAAVLPREAWDKVVEFTRANGTVIFVGPPPDLDVKGKSLSGEFGKLLEMQPLTLNRYLAAIEAVCTLPQGRSNYLDVCYPLKEVKGRMLVSGENELHGIKNAAGNIIYLTDLDPRERLLDLLESKWKPSVECHSDTILWRLYKERDREVLVLIARKDRVLRGLVRFSGQEFKLNGGTVALIESWNGKIHVRGDSVFVAS